MARVLVFGSINTDMVVYLPRLPHPGQTVSGGAFAVYPGGKGANSAVAASRAGARVRMYGAVGRDANGAERRASLEAEGIDTAGIVSMTDVPSGIAQIWVDTRGENSIAVAPGANAHFRLSDVRLGELEPGSVAAFQNEVPQATTEALIRALHDRGCSTIWNVAPECHEKPERGTLEAVDYLIFNENEIRGFAELLGVGIPAGDQRGRFTPERAAGLARSLCDLGVRSVIVTLGQAGSVLVSRERSETHRQAAFRAQAVDTVGAGDCFCGVFAASIASGLPAERAMRRAAAAAAVSVTRKGAQTSMPQATEIEALLSSGGGEGV